MDTIVGTLALKSEDGSVIRTAHYNTRQQERVRRDGKGNPSYNKEGATDYLKSEKSLWEASDQFIGEPLKIEEL